MALEESESSSVASSVTSADSLLFLSKYCAGFRSELQGLLLSVLMTVGLRARCPKSYGECLLAVTCSDNIVDSDLEIKDAIFSKEVSNISALITLGSGHTATTKSSQLDMKVDATPSKGLKKVGKPEIITSFDTLLEGIIDGNRDGITLNTLRTVLENAIAASDVNASSTLTKRARTLSAEMTADDGHDRTSLKLHLESGLVAYLVKNIKDVVSCHQILLSSSSEGTNSQIGKCSQAIDSVGMYVAYLCCNQSHHRQLQDEENVGISFYNWITALVSREMIRSESVELEQKASMIVQAVRLLKVLSEHYYATPLGEGTKVRRTIIPIHIIFTIFMSFYSCLSKFESVCYMYMHLENIILFN